MNCERAVDLIIDSLMDRLTDDDEAELEEHIRSCDACTLRRSEFTATWSSLRELPQPEPSSVAAVELGRVLGERKLLRRYSLLAAAAAVGFLLIGGAGGYGLASSRGASAAVTVEDQSPSFLLLVRGEPELGSTSPEQLVSEYFAWAGQLASQARLLGAEKLKDDPGRWLGPTGRSRDEDLQARSDIGGYFVIRAANYDAAEAIAMTSPHIKYGGTLEIREIDPVTQ